jgi:hypothetical protein
MNNSKRWQEFIKFWQEIRPKAHLYSADMLARVIDEQIKKIKRGDT